MNRYAIVLAAGQGTRMKSKRHKLLHHVCGKPVVEHALEAVQGLGVENIVTVVGHGADAIKATLGGRCKYAFQDQQLGTAHAVMQAQPFFGELAGLTIVMNGDAPAMNSDMLASLMAVHQQQGAKATILTEKIENPRSYGRVIRNEQGLVEKIVEAKDASPQEYAVKEINTGTYCFDNQVLFAALKEVNSHNAQQELYLTDVIEILRRKGGVVAAYCTDELHGATGVNDRIDLALAEKVVGDRIKATHMKKGVTIVDPASTVIHSGVEIGADTTICPGTIITGKTIIAENCVIGPYSEVHNCSIGEASIVRHSVVSDSAIGSQTTVGPFAHLRPESQLGNHVKIGNFVEVKKATIDENSKVSHLSYIGDAEIGKDSNVGCGAITVNYDGKSKHVTKIEDGAFIGCNVNMIAPITIGKNAIVAAGSTVTKDVPEEALAIAREMQTNKEGYANKIKGNTP